MYPVSSFGCVILTGLGWFGGFQGRVGEKDRYEAEHDRGER